MAQPYKANASGNIVTRTSDGASIPFDIANVDYQAYRAWVAAGGIPDDASLGNVLNTVFSNNLVKGLL